MTYTYLYISLDICCWLITIRIHSLTFWALALSDEGPMLEMLDYTIRIGSTPTFLYFNLYFYSAYAAHYVYFK